MKRKLKSPTQSEYKQMLSLIERYLYTIAYDRRRDKLDELRTEEDTTNLMEEIKSDMRLEPSELMKSVYNDPPEEDRDDYLFIFHQLSK